MSDWHWSLQILVGLAFGGILAYTNNRLVDWAAPRWPWRVYLTQATIGYVGCVVAFFVWPWWVASLALVWTTYWAVAAFRSMPDRTRVRRYRTPAPAIAFPSARPTTQWVFSNKRRHIVLTNVCERHQEARNGCGDRLWEVESSRVGLSGYGTFDTRTTYHTHLRDALHKIAADLWKKESAHA